MQRQVSAGEARRELAVAYTDRAVSGWGGLLASAWPKYATEPERFQGRRISK